MGRWAECRRYGSTRVQNALPLPAIGVLADIPPLRLTWTSVPSPERWETVLEVQIGGVGSWVVLEDLYTVGVNRLLNFVTARVTTNGYRGRVRAMSGSAFGEWSAYSSIAPS
jgi:hypothetical protein